MSDFIKRDGRVYHKLSDILKWYPEIEEHKQAFSVSSVADAMKEEYFEKDGEMWFSRSDKYANFYGLFNLEGNYYEDFLVPTPANWVLARAEASRMDISFPDFLDKYSKQVKYDVHMRHIIEGESKWAGTLSKTQKNGSIELKTKPITESTDSRTKPMGALTGLKEKQTQELIRLNPPQLVRLDGLEMKQEKVLVPLSEKLSPFRAKPKRRSRTLLKRLWQRLQALLSRKR